MAIGLCVAWVVVRSDLRFRNLLDAFVMLPLAVPGLVMAFGYLALTAGDLTSQQITTASLLAGLGFVTGVIAYLKLSHATPSMRHMSKIREEG